MKKIKNLPKYIIGAIIGIILVSTISVFAIEGVKAVIKSEEVSYDNTKSHGNYDNVQGSIDELYRRSGILDEEWKDPILHGADPVFDEKKELIPVTIDDDGTVHYANLYTKWYEYETKRWANAVILIDSEKGNYKTGDKIPESAIESYFVWIPRYKYKIWDLGNYTTAQSLTNLKDSATDATAGEETSFRRAMGNARVIDIVFQKKEEKTTNTSGECAPDSISGGGKSCQVGNYMTHPAFTLGNTELNGIWVGKFETGYKGATSTAEAQKDVKDSSKIIIKPNSYSWRNQTVGKMFKTALEYESKLGSHMMKNTEWGAIAYLSHSMYGIGNEVNINNNSDYKTGYSAMANTDQSSYPGTNGNGAGVTQPWNTPTGYLASTTGNITGVYDMSGGAHEYMAAYVEGYPGASGLSTELTNTNYAKYFDKYSANSNVTSYNSRILGDATGEMGPFYLYFDKDGNQRYHNAWYAAYSLFGESTLPWFVRGGIYSSGVLAGQFDFDRNTGGVDGIFGSRLVLAY